MSLLLAYGLGVATPVAASIVFVAAVAVENAVHQRRRARRGTDPDL